MASSQRHKTFSKFLSFALIVVMLLSAAAFLVGDASATSTNKLCTDSAAVYSNMPNTNYDHGQQSGGHWYLGIWGPGSTLTYNALLHFDVSSIPSSATISSVKLEVYDVDIQGSAQNNPISIYPITSSWSDSTVTYNTQPSIGGAVNTTILHKSTSPGHWAVFDVTSTVSDWIKGTSTNNGLELRAGPTGEIICDFFSESEGTSWAPYLNITYSNQALWAPTFTSSPTTTGTIGTTYTYTPTINETGTITSVIKPSAATFSAGSYSWTPSTSGTYEFEVQAVSTVGTLTAYHFWNVSVPSQWAPTFTSTPGTTGAIGSAYFYTPHLNETGTIANVQKPAAATFSGGSYSWTPSAAGKYQFEASGTSTNGTLTKYQFWNVTVPSQWAPTFTSSAPTTWMYNGSAWSFGPTINETGTITMPISPSGAEFIDGLAMWAPSHAGTFEFEFLGKSTAGTLSTALFFNVTVVNHHVHWAPTFTTTPLTYSKVFSYYTYQPECNESVTYFYHMGWNDLNPNWLSWTDTAIYGQPELTGMSVYGQSQLTDMGISYIYIKATSTNGTLTAWQNYTINVYGWADTYTSSPSLTCLVNSLYSYTPTTNASDYSHIDHMPSWASYHNGTISGTPSLSDVGVSDWEIYCTGSGQLDQFQEWQVNVTGLVPVILSIPSDNGMTLTWYDYQPVATLSCNWTVVSNADWMDINRFTGELSGVPGTAGFYIVELTATSIQYHTSVTQTYNVTVTLGTMPNNNGGGNTNTGGGTTTTTGTTSIFGVSLTMTELLALFAVIFVLIAIIAIASRGRRR